MSGHSKWSTIKHKKARTDAQRGKLFGRLIREITIAARSGADADANPRLRTAVAAARSANMPAANIERAIKKGSGGDGGAAIEEISYEGYGPGGVAILVDCMTDNRNRTAGEIRHLFSKGGGNLGENGCVAWKFNPVGWISVDRQDAGEDQVLALAVEAGAADVLTDDQEVLVILTEPTELHAVAKVLDGEKLPYRDLELVKQPSSTVDVAEPNVAAKVLRLMEALEDHDDVQNVWSDFDIPDEVIAQLAAS